MGDQRWSLRTDHLTEGCHIRWDAEACQLTWYQQVSNGGAATVQVREAIVTVHANRLQVTRRGGLHG